MRAWEPCLCGGSDAHLLIIKAWPRGPGASPASYSPFLVECSRCKRRTQVARRGKTAARQEWNEMMLKERSE